MLSGTIDARKVSSFHLLEITAFIWTIVALFMFHLIHFMSIWFDCFYFLNRKLDQKQKHEYSSNSETREH